MTAYLKQSMQKQKTGNDRLRSAAQKDKEQCCIYLKTKKQKKKPGWTTDPCKPKRLWRLYLAAPCGNDNDHLGSKRTTIHLNPCLPGKTHNPRNTHGPPLDRQLEKNGTLTSRDKTKQYPFLLVLFRVSMII